MIQSKSIVAAVFAATCMLIALPALADSQARIVRLSDVQGGVQIDKKSGLGFENAFLNLPVTQGAQVRTGARGRAEIEFEDGSTLRLTPNTTVAFGTLGLSDSGKRISSVSLVAGQAYVNWLGKSGDAFTLNFARKKIDLTQSAHFRIEHSAAAEQVANFKNEIEVIGEDNTTKVDKKKMLTFDAANGDEPKVARLQDSPYDEWDKQSVSYHDEYAKNNSTPLGYGASDLNYYGSYSNVAGYGSLWQPFFAGAGWNPYMDGAWSWYPGMGFMWASAYPWGWMPYYYGNWIYAQGYGWGWQPGGFNSWHGGLHYVGAVAGFNPSPVPKGAPRTVVVGKTATAFSSSGSRVVNNGTAGLGIARGSLSNLHRLNSTAAKSGFVQVASAPQFAASSPRFAGSGYALQPGEASLAAGSSHAASAPATHSSSGSGGHH